MSFASRNNLYDLPLRTKQLFHITAIAGLGCLLYEKNPLQYIVEIPRFETAARISVAVGIVSLAYLTPLKAAIDIIGECTGHLIESSFRKILPKRKNLENELD